MKVIDVMQNGNAGSMKNFRDIFKNVNGKDVLKQYARAHVLFFAFVQTLLLGFSRKSLEIVRLAVDNRVYSRLRKKNLRFIELYKEEHRSDYMEKKYNPVIWMMWLQGMDKAPDIVQKCYESIRKNIFDHEIVVITEKNLSQYVTLPDYILEKYKNGNISKTYFSDIVRIELLAVHGGTWIDSTVFCSGVPEHKYMLDSELFLFQTLKPGLDGHCRSVSSWMITAYSNSNIILLVRALLYHYLETHNFLIDYFILHDFIQMAIETYPEEWKRVVPFSNSTPHILLLRLFDRYDNNIWHALEKQTSFHKLSYKFDVKKYEQKGTYYDVILNNGKQL